MAETHHQVSGLDGQFSSFEERHHAQSLVTGVDDSGRKLASSPCGMSESDPAYIGYWSRGEVLIFLDSLLEGERAGIGAFAAIGRSIEQHLADLIFESELAQGAICVLLKKEMIRKGGAHMVGRRREAAPSNPAGGIRSAIAFARSHQARLADMIEDAVLNIFDSRLNAKLMYLLLLHRKQVELLDTVHAGAASGKSRSLSER
ncbi:hypothetical protein MTX26_24990 [Bradyrhizobium sp. ISRA443]|uniref:hypothetical protein n=1 Tax=unclassified Bradyrhizobium TaxID=2631580 RepID=UPI002478FAB9|nr:MULTISPECIES: hypothetical protein [unclassified Bradyrhizobium]WGR97633.1 hypothetical protein MTX23_24985 [Bradyrhizobium sp. ISRA436]WGS04523.1 hypothetical protein MTX18_24990 [Bradyrhizobium sp. ISRA437]WGS11404.1 hypothetical protein MTX26_24990 [Bradyrhizobium sp. ISRA443]